MAQSLPLSQIGFRAMERLVCPRQFCGSFCDQPLQIVMSTMERLLCLPAHGDLALQLGVLPGKLLKHAVDCLCKSVEFARSAWRCDAA
jgi:hypothetical protein